MQDEYEFETRAIRIQQQRTSAGEHSSPLFLTSSFIFDSAEEARAKFADEMDGFIYSRFSNPGVQELCDRLVSLEGAEDGLITATGMSAIFTTLAGLLNAGDHLVASRSLFGSSLQILSKFLPKWNIESTLVDLKDLNAWEGAIRPSTKLLFLETPSNPALDIVDLRKLVDLARSRKIPVIVDNTFATPYLQRPLELGCDVVLHSATKFLDGQGRVLGGAILGRRDLIDHLRPFARNTGPALSPFNAWILSRSLETLAVRMDRHCENALELARFLETRSGINYVRYPFLPSHPDSSVARSQMKAGGAIITFDLKSGLEGGRKFLDRIQLLSHTANLGDVRTILTHPASTTHSKVPEEERLRAGITPGLIRISTGLEHIQDLKGELERLLSE